MGSDEQTLKQARKLIGQRHFDGAIDLLSPIDDPSPDELFALAKSYFLKATSTEDGRKSKAAYRKAIKLFSDLQRTHPAVPDLLARTAVLALKTVNR